jgi:hypothetical protein
MWKYSAAALAVVLAAHAADPGKAFAEEARPAAIFPVELLDTSGEGEKSGQAERLALATRTLTEQIDRAGRYRSVDLTPFAAKIATTEPRYNCDGCWRVVAKDAGAEVAILAVVHKVSTLISTVNIYVADLKTDAYIAHVRGQFRGDDDTAYVRAFTFLVNERLNPK